MRVKGKGIRERGSMGSGKEGWIGGAMNGTKEQSVPEGDSIGRASLRRRGLTDERGRACRGNLDGEGSLLFFLFHKIWHR